MIGQLRRRSGGAHGGGSIPNYLCFTASEDTTFTLTIPSGVAVSNLSYVEYSLDNGRSWARTDNINNTQVNVVTPLVEEGSKVYWKGFGVRMSNGYQENNSGCRFSSDGKFDVSGVLTSLLTGTDTEVTSINDNTFVSLFNSSKVVNANDLILPKYCNKFTYAYTFKNCANLISAPNLPALVAANRCYYNMFSGCSSLIDAPAIAATSADFATFQGFMQNCTSLVTAPEINVSTITGNQCFQDCFQGCSNLKYSPSILPATIGTGGCYTRMFYNCTSLTTTPIIKLESLTGNSSCGNMFRNTKITTCELKPSTLAASCYDSMFYDSKLSYIKMLATDVSASNCLLNWMRNVPNVSTSIFVKHIDAQWTTTGNNGVPTNWTIIYYDPALDKYYTDQTRSQECDDHGNPI